MPENNPLEASGGLFLWLLFLYFRPLGAIWAIQSPVCEGRFGGAVQDPRFAWI